MRSNGIFEQVHMTRTLLLHGKIPLISLIVVSHATGFEYNLKGIRRKVRPYAPYNHQRGQQL